MRPVSDGVYGFAVGGTRGERQETRLETEGTRSVRRRGRGWLFLFLVLFPVPVPADPSFAHLHVHTDYSLLDGAARANFSMAGAAFQDDITVTSAGSMAQG